MLQLNDKKKLDIEILSNMAMPYKNPPRNKKGKVKFHAFANSLGNTSKANIFTKEGFVTVDVNSQFWKMIRHKENRSNLLMNIKDTLKSPLLIAQDGDSIFFFNSFKKQNGNLFNMVSVCGKDNEGELILKTSYQLRRNTKIEQFMRGERGEILHMKKIVDVPQKSVKLKCG